MKLASVRSLKLELFDRPQKLGAAMVSAFGAERADSPEVARRVAAATPGTITDMRVALGVASSGRAGDYILAARIQAGRQEARELEERVMSAAKGECDVRVVPRIRKRHSPAWYKKRRRPLECGLSVGHYDIGAGTLGCIVEDRDAYYVLSNNHVLADVNAGEPGDPVLQPGALDLDPVPANLIGVLDRYVPISFHRPNLVDCAIAQLEDSIEFYPAWTEALPGTIKRVRGVTEADLRRIVVKAGRTTGETRGTITQVEVDGLRVDMGDPGRPRIATFNSQFEVEGESGAFSQPGDSGSVIVMENGDAVGLLFAGGEDSSGVDLTFANRLDDAMAKLGVTLAK